MIDVVIGVLANDRQMMYINLAGSETQDMWDGIKLRMTGLHLELNNKLPEKLRGEDVSWLHGHRISLYIHPSCLTKGSHSRK